MLLPSDKRANTPVAPGRCGGERRTYPVWIPPRTSLGLEPLLDVGQLAAYLGVPVSTVYARRARGVVPPATTPREPVGPPQAGAGMRSAAAIAIHGLRGHAAVDGNAMTTRIAIGITPTAGTASLLRAL